MENNSDNLADKENTTNAPASENTTIPNDFWNLVQQQRASAKARVETRKQNLYQPFRETKTNLPVPMPTDFWEAVKSKIDENVAPTPESVELVTLYDSKNETKTKQPLLIEQVSPITETKENGKPLTFEIAKKVLREHSISLESLEKKVENNIEEPEEESLQENEEDAFIEIQESEIIYLPGLSFKEAALTILMREKRPMTAVEIADIATKEGLIVTTGKTPHASIVGQISTDIKRNPDTPFVSIGSRTYTLKPSYKRAENSGTGKTQGIVISVNFSGQEETAEKATKPILLDSKITTQEDERKGSEELKEDLTKQVLQENQKVLGQKKATEPIKPTSENPKMTFKQAAFYLLERMKRPMTANEIGDIIIKESLVDSTSKKPDASVAGQLYTDMEKLGEKSAFRLVAPRTFGLADWYKKNEN